jgi:phospholipid/cholesterol/gamma-HCH transport system substrate-binding protein
MKISTAQKLKTGVLVLVSILILLFIIYIIGTNNKIFGSSFFVYANFKNIAGTREGNIVRFAGINVGTVEGITLLNDTTVQLRLSIEKKIHSHIKQGAVATIGNDGLMGDKLIILHPAPAGQSQDPVNEGQTLRTIDPVDADKILNNLSRISANGDSITTGLSSIINKINNGDGLFGRIMSDKNFANKLDRAIDKTSEAVGTLKKTAGSVNENMEAAKHSFLLKGYFRKKEKQRIRDSVENAKKNTDPVKKTKD